MHICCGGTAAKYAWTPAAALHALHAMMVSACTWVDALCGLVSRPAGRITIPAGYAPGMGQACIAPTPLPVSMR